MNEKKYAEEFGKDLDNRITFIYPYDTMRSHKDEYVYYKLTIIGQPLVHIIHMKNFAIS